MCRAHEKGLRMKKIYGAHRKISPVSESRQLGALLYRRADVHRVASCDAGLNYHWNHLLFGFCRFNLVFFRFFPGIFVVTGTLKERLFSHIAPKAGCYYLIFPVFQIKKHRNSMRGGAFFVSRAMALRGCRT